MKKYIAEVSVPINAPVDKVWKALTNPETVKAYMFGTNVISKWEEGGAINWFGEWEGNHYEEKGIITKLIPAKRLQYTRYNNLSGLQDVPESYQLITIDLLANERGVSIALTEDNNSTEHAKERSEEVWKTILNNLKELMERE
ncbi:SRPBCC family protein [Fulvivirgaceae bacterium BMA12]|uniref:SRPBCC family protein n=1 Tax=Agaribacillus aureus TaxID=3051825 RepID=A0ABT8LJW3_9BACT|nr:SRPBCC family protein [Fulvivirgaceae bacterium BMA12]